jgi:hypothetical protein
MKKRTLKKQEALKNKTHTQKYKEQSISFNQSINHSFKSSYRPSNQLIAIQIREEIKWIQSMTTTT